MLDFDAAQEQLARAGTPPNIQEICPLGHAHRRILAQTLFATLDLPPADNSAMDGYAMRLSDYQAGGRLPVQQRCYAGQQPEPLKPGQAIRLFTGSLMPEGADTVVMQENAREDDGFVEVLRPPLPGEHVRKRGEDVRCNEQLLGKGTVLDAGQLALLASQGYAEIPVYPRLQVGILTTGDELVPPGQPRAEQQIFDSNGPMLSGVVAAMGAQVRHVLHATDTEEALESAFNTLLADCDLVLTVGGVSVGEKDLVKPVLQKLGAELNLWKVAMKPGKPVALAHAAGKPVVCLPGNPVSAFVVFTLLVTPLIRTLQGRADIFPRVEHGRLETALTFLEKREEFLRVQVEPNSEGLPALVPYHQQGSNIISSLAWADALARVPAGQHVGNGDIIRHYPLAHWLA